MNKYNFDNLPFLWLYLLGAIQYNTDRSVGRFSQKEQNVVIVKDALTRTLMQMIRGLGLRSTSRHRDKDTQ